MAVTEEDSVKKAIEAGKEEDIVRLREQGCPIRHEHLVLIRSVPKIRDALSSLSGNTRKMRRAFEDAFCKVLLVQKSFNHLLHVNTHGYSALNELARKNDWDLIIE
ncbi:hypothetical protein WR25_23992 isoform B [Diploscapter pachys]|uniref:Uncharacterized protein n=1 Tax=Diploscapter pachys TaxID=2018661 RepID=A0A2A2L091_9BILA|nr:hypothetical protein WR25_23992 isoform A [Diploscapter pachys]PAV79589.1 hypothetical protein WR25_23992 isoform B [Diploscapter pachys]